MISFILTALLLIPLCAFFGSLCGGRPKVPGRGVYWAAPIIALFTWLALGITGAIAFTITGVGTPVLVTIPIAVMFGLAYAATMGPGWKVGFILGDITPRTKRQKIGTVIRHSFCLAFAYPIWLAGGLPIFLIAYPIVATLLAVRNAKWFDKGIDKNALVEVVRGATLGAALFLSLVVQR